MKVDQLNSVHISLLKANGYTELIISAIPDNTGNSLTQVYPYIFKN